jgi:membrane protein YqaA with SNARE-associated domain
VQPPSGSDPNASAALVYSEPPPGELAGYMRKNFARAALLILALVGVMTITAVWFEHELLVATENVYRTVGTLGLMAIAFVNDVIISPLPPEALLVVIAKTELSQRWPELVLLMGLLSAAAGNVAWWLGRTLGDRFLSTTLEGVRKRHGRLIRRYGGWTIALSALTPLPFSVSCMAAGALQFSYSKFWWLTLLRVPRFFLFYWIVAYSDRLLTTFL